MSQNNPGTGSSTLNVSADIDAVVTSTGTPTDLTVTVKDGLGNNVSGAVVTIANLAWGVVTLPETATGSGKYRSAQPAFPSGNFALSVTRGADNVQGVVVGGPSVHGIQYPPKNAIVPANQNLQVTWTTPTQALAAAITTNNFGTALGPDTGTYVIPAASNPPATGQMVNVARYNEVSMAGGLPGSRLRVTVEATVSPYTVQ